MRTPFLCAAALLLGFAQMAQTQPKVDRPVLKGYLAPAKSGDSNQVQNEAQAPPVTPEATEGAAIVGTCRTCSGACSSCSPPKCACADASTARQHEPATEVLPNRPAHPATLTEDSSGTTPQPAETVKPKTKPQPNPGGWNLGTQKKM